MKKLLVVTLILMISMFAFAAEELRMELLKYWQNNGIAYQDMGLGIVADVTANKKVQVLLMKEDEKIYFSFDLQSAPEDFDKFVSEQRVAPFSSEFKQKIIQVLYEGISYRETMGQFPKPMWGYFGDYYAKYEIKLLTNVIVVSIY